MDEVNHLDAMGVDAVVGMAIYTGRMRLPDARANGEK
jgi:phosphoribosylformimino-5-aminoimidazole carboxamide ribonucleotide (ProFAR) isomerase